MLPVEILPVQETLVLRARGSELLILPHHIRALKDLEKPKDFSHYFRAEALVNRPARKLFEAWLRKDHTLWPRLYKVVHKEMELSAEEDGDADSTDSAKPEKKAAEEPALAKETAKEAKDEPAKEATAKKKTKKKSTAKKTTEKKKTAAKKTTKTAKKSTAKKATKSTDKKKTTTKKKSTAAKKTKKKS